MPRKDPEARKAYLREYAARNKEIAYERVKEWRKNNPERWAEQNKRYVEKHPDKVKAKTLRSRIKHIEIRRIKDCEAAAKYRKSNKEKVATAKKKYAQIHKEKINASVAKRKAAKLHRSPNWLTLDERWMIEQAYELAVLRTNMLGFSWHVDHIIPLQGETVSGLHVPTNLQVIPGVDNIRKKNKYGVEHGRT